MLVKFKVWRVSKPGILVKKKKKKKDSTQQSSEKVKTPKGTSNYTDYSIGRTFESATVPLQKSDPLPS